VRSFLVLPEHAQNALNRIGPAKKIRTLGQKQAASRGSTKSINARNLSGSCP
jgi:hypothetical protein